MSSRLEKKELKDRKYSEYVMQLLFHPWLDLCFKLRREIEKIIFYQVNNKFYPSEWYFSQQMHEKSSFAHLCEKHFAQCAGKFLQTPVGKGEVSKLVLQIIEFDTITHNK